jgi:hypothetical protein
VECLLDLQETAARLLVLGGRLSFWMPDFTDLETEGDGQAAAADWDATPNDLQVSLRTGSLLHTCLWHNRKQTSFPVWCCTLGQPVGSAA